MKKFTTREYIASIILFFSSLGIAITKVFLFSSARFFYAFFFVAFIALFFFLFRKHKNFIKDLLLLTFPTEIILFVAINTTHKLHWVFDILTGLWILLLFFLVVHNWIQKHKKDKRKEDSEKIYTPFSIVILLIIITLHFGLGFYHLGKAAYVDERLWTYSNEKRIEKYWNNILEMDWKHTRPSDKPGVTLAIVSGPSLLFVTPSDFKKEIINKQAFEQMLFAMRLPLLIISTFALILFFSITATVFNKNIGIFATAFIGLSPLLLGMSRIVNPDALTWIIIPLTLLAFFAYLRTRNHQWIYTTGFLLGLGLLTKYITNILFPFFFIILLTYPLFLSYTKKQLRLYIRTTLSAIGIVTLIAIATFYIFYPGTWVKMDRILLGTIWSQPFAPIWHIFVTFTIILAMDYFFNKSSILLWLTIQLYKVRRFFIALVPVIFSVALISLFYYIYLNSNSINFENVLLSPKTSLKGGTVNFFEAFIISFYPLIFGISPLALSGLLLALFFSFFKKEAFGTYDKVSLWHLLFFVIIFFTGSIFSATIPTVRYQIILYPLILIISGYGWFCLYIITKKHTKEMAFYILLMVMIYFGAYTLFTFKPFYFSYNSPLLPQSYLINPKDMGDGNYEMAQYLNSLPNAKNLNIWSDKRGVCAFFNGKCVSVIRKKDFIENGPHYDYFVISKGREARTVDLSRGYSQMREEYPIRLDLLYTSPDAVFELHPGNRQTNYIRVIPEEKIHVWRGH